MPFVMRILLKMFIMELTSFPFCGRSISFIPFRKSWYQQFFSKLASFWNTWVRIWSSIPYTSIHCFDFYLLHEKSVMLRSINVMFSGYEVKEALRVQMEVQSKLHLQVEVCFLLLWRSKIHVWFRIEFSLSFFLFPECSLRVVTVASAWEHDRELWFYCKYWLAKMSFCSSWNL